MSLGRVQTGGSKFFSTLRVEIPTWAHFNRNRGFDGGVDPRFFTFVESAISMAVDYGRGIERFHKVRKF